MKTFLLLLIFSFSSFASVTKTYSVPDMVCDHCAKTITKELVKIRGIKKEHVKFDVDKKQVTITFEDNKPLNNKELKTIQFEAGYDLLIK